MDLGQRDANGRSPRDLVLGDDFEPYILPGTADLSDVRTEKVPGELVLARYNVQLADHLRKMEAGNEFWRPGDAR